MRKLAVFLSLLVGMSLFTPLADPPLADPPLAQAQISAVQIGINGMI